MKKIYPKTYINSFICGLLLLLASSPVTNTPIDDANNLISSMQDSHPSVEGWSCLLAYHGFNIPKIGMLLINNTSYHILEDGSLVPNILF